MLRPSDSAPTWTGTPPVVENGFSFANGEFFVDSSNHNRHRRAKPCELREHFREGTDKDQPAHWFEAQLIHYGLPPSKKKSTARLRLFDAVRSDKLVVPRAISELEAKLKKEWTQNDREARKAREIVDKSQSATKTKASWERVAFRNANALEYSDDSDDSVPTTIKREALADLEDYSIPPRSSGKKARTSPMGFERVVIDDSDNSDNAPAGRVSVKRTSPSRKPRVGVKREAIDDSEDDSLAKTFVKRAKNAEKYKTTFTPRIPAAPTTISKKKTSIKKEYTTPTDRKPPVVHRNGISQSQRQAASAKASTSARRSRSSTSQRRTLNERDHSESSHEFDSDWWSDGYSDGSRCPDNDEDSDGSGCPDNDPDSDGSRHPDSGEASDDDDSPGVYNSHLDAGENYATLHTNLVSDPDPDTFGEHVKLKPLGNLNGYYHIASSCMPEPHGRYRSGLNIRLVLHGCRLRGSFEFGEISGVFLFLKRPWEPSHERIPFIWRGRTKSSDVLSYGDDGKSYIKFLGDGRIEGEIFLWFSIPFTGERLEAHQRHHDQLDFNEAVNLWNASEKGRFYF